MFWVTVYLVVTYGLVGILLALLLGVMGRGPWTNATEAQWHRIARVRTGMFMVLLSLPLLPYAVVTLQTVVFLPSLRPALQQAIVLDWGVDAHPRIIRVLRVGPSPLVYAVLPCTGMVERGEVGALYRFQRTPGGWQWDGVPDVSWSECGSADGNTFPPYPEAQGF